MSSTLTIIRQRRNRRDRHRRSADGRARRAFFGFGYFLGILTVMLVVAGALAYADLTRGLPPVETLPALLDPYSGSLLEPTRLYDRSGQHLLAVLAPEDSRRTYIPYDRLPQALIEATVAAAEPGFWTSAGYQVTGWQDPLSHPTIAQRMVADLLLWDESPSVRRALRERLLAGQLVAVYGREQVLAWYLNSADYGRDAYGIEAAARLYFGKSAADLDLGEAALLAAVAEAPALNPLDAAQAAEGRRQEVLRIMLALQMLTTEELAQAQADAPVPVAYPEDEPFAPAFVAMALAQLDGQFGNGRAARGGLVVVTSLDYDLQVQAECAARSELARAAGQAVEILAFDGRPCEAARLLPILPAGLQAESVTVSALVLDPTNGQVLAAVGDLRLGQEAAFLSAHPAGTALTPLVYLTAFTRGFSPGSLGWDIPGRVAGFDREYRGPVRLRLALANDYLPPTAALLDQLGAESVRRLSEPLGLTIPPGADLLGDAISATPLELARAYAIFANQGTLAGGALSGERPGSVTILTVTGTDHAVWADWSTPVTQAIVSPQLAYLITHIMSDETVRWPSLGRDNPLEVGFPAGVKLGQFRDGMAAWTVGYTPNRVVVVWVGQEAALGAEPAQSGTAPTAARTLSMGVWHALIQYAADRAPLASWEVPVGIVRREVCDPSGQLPTSACPNVVSEVFLSGNEPVQADTLFQTYAVNRETGLLATVFTPPELIDERVYMIVPPEARTWADGAGVAVPPTAYDVVQEPVVLPGAHITSPGMFADVRGQINLRGSAMGEDFVSYRVEYGQGLNPQAWVQIGSDVTTPVDEGLLVQWDTAGLDGLYAVRLLVVYADQRVSRAVIQVAVDNTPPQIGIGYPTDGQEIDFEQERQVAFQVQVSDPYLERIEFYVDGTLVGTVTSAPYAFSWPARSGAHTLRVVAYDRVGNSAEAEAEFTVER
ncbi:MAG: penicillin-binding protein [Anaerolineales bacterium]|nr:penicillin-binding protein [Anaerolineales bacterium]